MRNPLRDRRSDDGTPPNRRGTVALFLGGLAVVLASTGTAVAVTTTTVQIADPITPSRIATVDQTNHLVTTGATSPISASGLIYAYQGGDNFITSPTTATLAISKVSLSETAANAGTAGTNFRVYLYKVGVDAAGNCASTGYIQLAIYQFGAGDSIVDDFAEPLTVKATGSAKYCLDFFTNQLGPAGTLTYFPAYHVTAYVVKGTYTGIGTGTAAANAPAKTTARGDAK